MKVLSVEEFLQRLEEKNFLTPTWEDRFRG